MSITDVMSRIAQLQAQMGLQPAAFASSSDASSTDFSSALDGALGTSGTSGTSGTTGTSGASPGSATGTSSTGEQAVALARSYVGVPYRWGGTDPSTGLDCSGLTQLVYGKLGISLPRVAADQAKAGTAVPSLAQAQPGDLVFFGSPAHHVGIYAGNGMMIDAPHTGTSVGVHAISGYGPVSAIRRVAPAASATPDATANSLAVARAQLLSAAGLSSLTGLSPTTSDLASTLTGLSPTTSDLASTLAGLSPTTSDLASTLAGLSPSAASDVADAAAQNAALDAMES